MLEEWEYGLIGFGLVLFVLVFLLVFVAGYDCLLCGVAAGFGVLEASIVILAGYVLRGTSKKG